MSSNYVSCQGKINNEFYKIVESIKLGGCGFKSQCNM